MSKDEQAGVTLSIEQYVDLRLEPWVEWRSGMDNLTEDRRLDLYRRLEGLNGEAGRLKTILENSVPLTTFHAYVNNQRDKDDAKEQANRERFEAYVGAVSKASQAQADAITAKIASLNLRFAGFVGGGVVLVWLLNYFK